MQHFSSRRVSVVGTLAAFTIGLKSVAAVSTAGSTAASAGVTGAVVPSLHCVSLTVPGHPIAFFGYDNQNTKAVKIPIGTANHFSPTVSGTKDRGQPTTFAPGVHNDAFAVSFTSATLAWTLTGPNGASTNVAVSVVPGSSGTPICAEPPIQITASEAHTAISGKPGHFKYDASHHLTGASVAFSLKASSLCPTGGVPQRPIVTYYVYPYENNSASGPIVAIGTPTSYPFVQTAVVRITDPQKSLAPFIQTGAALGYVTATVVGSCDLGDGYVVASAPGWEPSDYAQQYCYATDAATQTLVDPGNTMCIVVADYTSAPGGSGGIKTH